MTLQESKHVAGTCQMIIVIDYAVFLINFLAPEFYI
jgi:hypothetical protein